MCARLMFDRQYVVHRAGHVAVDVHRQKGEMLLHQVHHVDAGCLADHGSLQP